MKELKKLIEDTTYNKVVKMIVSRVSISVDNEVYEAHYIKYEDFKNKAKISFEQLLSILQSKIDVVNLVNYVSKKLIKYDGCNEQEYPEGEELGKDDNDIVISDDGYSITFLAFHLIEFCVLKNNRSHIDDYVKLIRIPNAKKYSKEIQIIYDDVTSK